MSLQVAIAACNVDGRCRCGEPSGHMGWLVCVSAEVDAMLDAMPKVGIPRDLFAGTDTVTSSRKQEPQ